MMDALVIEPALERLKRFHPKSMDLSLGRMRRLLTALGNPERRLPPVIHVAGTNGKGSTVAFMRSILETAGLCVHVYTSPHLVRFNERIRIAGELVSDDQLIRLIDEVEAINRGEMITFFEITTAIAFHAFARTPADAVLLETGLGGVMDATNVVETPIATAITRISFDHTHLLGNTIRAIATEKAGIMKPSVPAILSWQREADACDVIESRARAIDAPLFSFGDQWHVKGDERGFRYEDTLGSLQLPLPALKGAHQLLNAGTAIAALRYGDRFRLSPQNFADGMQRVEWPGRLQQLTQGPLVKLLPFGSELWLDGGHNDSGGEVLGEQAAKWTDMPLSLVFGMLTTKEPAEFLKYLAPYIMRLLGIAIPGEELTRTAEDVTATALAAGISAETADGVDEAVRRLIEQGPPRQRILICGSLYLAGYVLANNS